MINDGLNSIDRLVESILMIGQSNMAGRGDMNDVPPIENENCYMLRMARWQRMREPINPDRSMFVGKYKSGISLAASFADDFANHIDAPVGLIPCADGGTRLEQWMPGELLFDHAVAMTQLAQRTSELKCIIWHQGEGDCGKADSWPTYKDRFIRMMTEMRKQLGAENVPVLIGELATTRDPEKYNLNKFFRMNGIFAEIAAELPLCAVVSSEGLTLQEDGIHFNSVSLREFGHRYFAEFLKIKEANKL